MAKIESRYRGKYPVINAVTSIGTAALGLAFVYKLVCESTAAGAGARPLQAAEAAEAPAPPNEMPALVVPEASGVPEANSSPNEPPVRASRPEAHTVHAEKPRMPSTEYRHPLVRSAMELYEDFQHLPYVWGGESPKTYEDTMKDTFFADIKSQVTRKQPPGSFRSGQPTEPGFDCSGFLWYAGKRAGLQPFSDDRLTANGYMNRSVMVLGPGKHTADELKENTKEGYLIFKTKPDGRAFHVGICLGDGLVLESSGIEEPDYAGVPGNEWERWRSQYGNPDNMRGGLQISPVGKFAKYNTAICGI
jgi:cell wall-associated NlpC family hydrolase